MGAEGRDCIHPLFLEQSQTLVGKVLDICQINDQVPKMYAFHNHCFWGTRVGVVLHLVWVLAPPDEVGGPGRYEKPG